MEDWAEVVGLARFTGLGLSDMKNMSVTSFCKYHLWTDPSLAFLLPQLKLLSWLANIIANSLFSHVKNDLDQI